MSFVSSRARLTRARWLQVLTLGVLALAPLVGTGAHGRGVALMSPAAPWGDGIEATIFWHVRLPRALAAALVGAALAAAGCANAERSRKQVADCFPFRVCQKIPATMPTDCENTFPDSDCHGTISHPLKSYNAKQGHSFRSDNGLLQTSCF